jgi:hypothetical protein
VRYALLLARLTKTPMRRIRCGCCTRAATGHARTNALVQPSLSFALPRKQWWDQHYILWRELQLNKGCAALFHHAP